MSLYDCEYCNEKFTYKHNLLRHQRTIHKSKNSNNDTNKKILNKCIHCDKSLSRPDALKRHMEICKVKMVNNKRDNTVNGTENNAINGDKNQQITKTIKNNSDNIYNTNNVNLISFAKDGIDSITRDDVNKILNTENTENTVIEEFFTIANYDKNKPQHHNVYCKDLKSGVGHVFEEDGWNVKCLSDVASILLTAKANDLDKILKKFGHDLTNSDKKQIIDAINDARGYDPQRGVACSQKARRNLLSRIKHIMYNRKQVVLDTIKKNKGLYGEAQMRRSIKKSKKVPFGDDLDDIAKLTDVDSDDDYDVEV